MSVPLANVRKSNIRVESDTVGGDTYFVKLPGRWETEKALCFRQMKNDHALRCTHEAGYGTDHVGTGACKYHGGNSVGRITTGQHATKARMRLDGKIQQYLGQDRAKVLDLTYELAATRAVFQEFLEEKFPGTEDEEYGIALFRFNQMIGTLGTLVEKISKIENRNTLTAAQVLYLRATVTDLLLKYIPDPDVREQAVRELAIRMGGDVEVEMSRSEYSLPGKVVDVGPD